MFMLQEWMWMALALTAITFSFTIRSPFLLWVSLASTVVGTLVWADPAIPMLYQLLIFGAATLGCVVIAQFFIKPKPESESRPAGDEEQVVKAMNPSTVIHRTFTLTQPIVEGFGEIEVDGTRWRVRGEDAAAGEQIRVLSVDGLERDLLIVAKEEWARRTLDQAPE